MASSVLESTGPPDQTHSSLPGPSPSSPKQLLEANWELIEKVVVWVCRRNHCSHQEAEELRSDVQTKLLADDCAVLRKYRGTSTIETYLTVVVQNVFRDYRNRRWGKWRPSAEAQRLGAVAIKLEELVWRDGFSLHEACEILISNFRMEISRANLEKIAARLPLRIPRRFESEESLQNLAVEGASPADQILYSEAQAAFSQAVAALEAVLDALPDDDRLIVRMSFEEDCSVAEIAHSLCLDQKKLYRRLEKILKKLRHDLEARGIRWEEIRAPRP